MKSDSAQAQAQAQSGPTPADDSRGELRDRARKHSAWYRRLAADDVELKARAKTVCFEPRDGLDVSALRRYFDGMSVGAGALLAPPGAATRSPSAASDEGCALSSDEDAPRTPGDHRDDSAVELDECELPSSPTAPRRVRIRSSLLLEAQCVAVPLPEDFHGDRKLSLDEGGLHRTRFVRTPSVIVSDYSEDCQSAISPDEVDYFRRRLRPDDSGSDCSLDSSCSNLNSCCGSQLSMLDGELGLRTPERKTSDCSSCSTLSGNEDDDPDSGLGRTCPRVNKIAMHQ